MRVGVEVMMISHGYTRCAHAWNTLEERWARYRFVQHSFSTSIFAVCSLDMRLKHARCSLGVRYVFAGCALGVRYTLADEHTTNTQRVLRVSLALVQRALRVSGVGAARSASLWRFSAEYIHASSPAHIFVHAQKSRRTERMTTNA